jgi:Ca2+-transporting ATPase
MEGRLPRVFELPFESERKRMTTVHARDDAFIGYTKGAPEAIVGRCKNALGPRGRQPITTQQILDLAHGLAAQGLRVLAVAKRDWRTLPHKESADRIESGLTLLGLVGLIDPPRLEAKDAVAACRQAGIVPIMITGDHPQTAMAIAYRLGIASPHNEAMAGADLARISQEELTGRIANIAVFARVDPAQKIRIVEALQARGEFVAMTGDGVNDAPALQRANVGVAMGVTGTDVAREASDLILLDDNFATIVSAIKEGRRIFDNIRKFLRFMLTGNSAEIWTMFLAPFVGLPMPLLPIQILWINLVTDSLPALALAVEPAERDAMHRPPRPPMESVLAGGLWQHAVWVGLLIAGVSLFAQAIAIHLGWPNWQTMVFTILTFAQMGHVLGVRSERRSLLSLGMFSNRPLIGAVALVIALQLVIIYAPPLNAIFETNPLGFREFGLCLALSVVPLFAVEIEKAVRRRRLLESRP